MASGKYSVFKSDPDLKRWLTNLSRGSPVTAEVYMRRVGRVCELLDTTPKGLLNKSRSDLKVFQDSLEDLVTRLESEKKSPGYIRGLLKSVRSWLRYNDVTLTRKIKISNPNATPTIEEEQIPSKEELSRILRASSSRVRVAEVLIAFADLRPHTLGNHDGSDGLTLGDLPELEIVDGNVVFEKVPTMVVVRSNLSKTRQKYFTFLSEEGCTYLREYLEERMRSGEKLGKKNPFIAFQRTSSTRKFMITRKITLMIREAMRRAGVWKRPYVLRAYAETQLIIAESKGKISHPYLQFIAGHKGDIESRYSTNKGRLPEEMVEGMRDAYKACEPFLSTVAQPLEHSSIVKEAKVEALKSIAKNLLGIDLLEVKVAKEREVGRELDRDEEIELFENEIRKMREGEDDPQMLVREEELESYLNDGWEFVSVLPSKMILIRK
ncbi:MAG: site-specific integrase [Candidatus Bathyarchaeota archaeon]|nr:site-specific integrase [Candidatus Bathyarchaeota archaeon]